MSRYSGIKALSKYLGRSFSTEVTGSQRVILKAPSSDVRSIVNNIDEVIHQAKLRELPQTSIDAITSISDRYQAVKQLTLSLNELLQIKNRIQMEIKAALKNKQDIEHLKEQQLESRNREKELAKNLKREESILREAVDLVPNSIHESVTDKEQIVNVLNPREEYRPDISFDHTEIGKELGIIDMRSGSVVSGGSWYFLLGDGALLEQALVQHALSLARKHGFQMVIPPSIVRNEVADACGFKPRDQNGEQQSYQLSNGDWCLTGTAEIPLAGLSINRTFKESELPYKVVGLSRSYRAEAGARGKDTKGLYRVHEFTKVELFVWATEQQSNEELEKLREFQESLISSLGLSAKVINMPYNDLGAPASKKYDIEAWMPGRGTFGEVTSASNCLDYQARRLHAKYNKQGEKKTLFVHTLNGTAMAVPRVIVAILENFYDQTTKKVTIPEVLRKYMDGKEFIQA
jgi:seryl-tRNA synthetase